MNQASQAPTPQQVAASERTARLLNDPPLKTMLALGLPTIIVVMTQICVGIIETYWTSRLGTDSLAGVTLVAPLTALMTTMSNGGIGGGVSSSIARALGARDTERANQLLWHAVIIALGFGLAFTLGVITLGPLLYGALGGEGRVLHQALIYSAWVFGGSVPLWLMNLLSSAMRGSGDVKFPATISLIGAAVTVPLSPALIFGWGPLPAMGIAGAGAAVLIFYLGAVAALVRRLTNGGAGLSLKVTPLTRDAFGAILGVGLISAMGTILANLTTVFVTGAVGLAGGAVLAGYGVASRIDFLLIPLLFGFATAVVTVVGLATGAGNLARAREAGWKAGALAFAVTQSVGLVVTLFPAAWMGIFSDDPAVIAAGSTYLRFAAPAYGAFGLGLMLYFASQGLGRVQWPLIAGVSRFILAGGGAWILASHLDGVAGPGVAVALGSLIFGAVNAFGFVRASRPRGEAGQSPSGPVE